MDEDCTVYRTIEMFSRRWTLLILFELSRSGALRFSSLKGKLPGITAKILSLRLKEMEADGLVGRKVTAETAPVAVEYALTASGRDFFRVLESFKRWGLKHKAHGTMCEGLSCTRCGLND